MEPGLLPIYTLRVSKVESKQQRPGFLPGTVFFADRPAPSLRSGQAVRPSAVRSSDLRDRIARTALWNAPWITSPVPRITFLVGQWNHRRYREARQRVLRELADIGQPIEAPVIDPAMRFLGQGKRTLEQQLAHELRVHSRRREPHDRRATTRSRPHRRELRASRGRVAG